jgi:hypothetical protein
MPGMKQKHNAPLLACSVIKRVHMYVLLICEYIKLIWQIIVEGIGLIGVKNRIFDLYYFLEYNDNGLSTLLLKARQYFCFEIDVSLFILSREVLIIR